MLAIYGSKYTSKRIILQSGHSCCRHKNFTQIMSLTEEYGVDLHGFGRVPYTRADGRRENIQTFSKKLLSFTACRSNLYNEPEFKLTHSSNHTEHCRKLPFYLASTKHDFTSSAFLHETHWLLVTNKRCSPFLRAKHCQGQLRNPESMMITLGFGTSLSGCT
jgi:hypothetical protein